MSCINLEKYFGLETNYSSRVSILEKLLIHALIEFFLRLGAPQSL